MSHENQVSKKRKLVHNEQPKCTTFLDLLRGLGPFGRQELFKWNRPSHKRFDGEIAARLGYLDFFKGTPTEKIKVTPKFTRLAARHKHLELLEWLLSENMPMEDNITSWAAQGGSLEILEFLHSKNMLFSSVTLSSACESGNLECVQYVHTVHDVPIEDVHTFYAVKGGNVLCLQYVHERGAQFVENVYETAILSNSMACISYLFYNGARSCSRILCDAARYGNLECMKFVHNTEIIYKRQNCESVVYVAATRNKLDCLNYAIVNMNLVDINLCRLILECVYCNLPDIMKCLFFHFQDCLNEEDILYCFHYAKNENSSGYKEFLKMVQQRFPHLR